ncbi:hypothetical protein [Agromyces sp. Leaf222]|uniref:hypothetical protein n=1 Tax=Agromyces sp. Leaf222 TaxID=1735688 RepID=UPI000701EB9F|nr:hypothetical protein [Agromyces sp. Leaf222]KQM83920.1 hypothetical protein ASE68_12510 [Agromyces sp. Leaf222]
MSAVVPVVLVSSLLIGGGVVLIWFRGPVSRWFSAQHGSTFGRRKSRSRRAFNAATMILVGSFWILMGVMALTSFFTQAT